MDFREAGCRRHLNRLVRIAGLLALVFSAQPALAQSDLTSSNQMIDAAAIGNADVVEYWLKRGAQVDTRDDDGRTILIYGAFVGSLDIVSLALESRAAIDRQDKGGFSALSWAADQGHYEVVQRLLEEADRKR